MALIKQKYKTSTSLLVKRFVFLIASITFYANGQEVDVKATVSATGYVYEAQFGDNEATQGDSILISPSLFGSYSSRLLTGSLAANHSIVKRNNDSLIGNESTNQNYTDLKYTSTLELIENALFLTLNGAQKYRNINQQQEFFSDAISNSGSLTKTQTNSAQLNFTNPNPLYLGLNVNSSYLKTKTDRSEVNNFGIDSNNLRVTADLYQGKNISSVNFDISAQYNDTSRANLESFKSTIVQGDFSVPFSRYFSFLINGRLEDYDTGQSVFSGRTNLDTNSYGAGFEWSPGNRSNLSLTYNQLDEGDKTTEFIGLNIDWAFSSRTGLNFEYGKRFYGNSYDLNFSHSLKSLRTSVSYSEDVTSFSRLGASTTNITGIFVCEFGSTELIDCFQPDSLNYQLQAGEEFRTTTEIETDITEEVLFLRSGTALIGYERRKITMSIETTYRKVEYLESNRINTNQRLRFNFNYALSRKTNISFSSTIAENKNGESENPDNIVTTNLTFTRSVGRYLKLNLGARLLDRRSKNPEREASDKRINLGLTYTF